MAGGGAFQRNHRGHVLVVTQPLQYPRTHVNPLAHTRTPSLSHLFSLSHCCLPKTEWNALRERCHTQYTPALSRYSMLSLCALTIIIMHLLFKIYHYTHGARGTSWLSACSASSPLSGHSRATERWAETSKIVVQPFVVRKANMAKFYTRHALSQMHGGTTFLTLLKNQFWFPASRVVSIAPPHTQRYIHLTDERHHDRVSFFLRETIVKIRRG